MKTVVPLGTLTTKNGLFCGSDCRRGCLRKEYSAAVKAAYRLTRRLGPEWREHVWENLGWHYKVIGPGGIITIHPGQGEDFTAFVEIDGNQLAVVNGDTLEQTLQAIRDTATRHYEEAARFYASAILDTKKGA